MAMVMIHDVDKDFNPKDISEMMAMQNTELGLNLVDACTAIRPLFKRGPRDHVGDCWVCEVRPDVHEILLKWGEFSLASRSAGC